MEQEIDRVVQLSDPDCPSDAPFEFRIGYKVAKKRWDGSPDLDFVGVVVNGICRYKAGGGSYVDLYEVKREEDGLYYKAKPLDLVRL